MMHGEQSTLSDFPIQSVPMYDHDIIRTRTYLHDMIL